MPPSLQNGDFPDSVAESIHRQVEYYLSDENLATDGFLRDRMDQEGWLDVNLIAGFKKMQALRPRGAEKGWVDTVCLIVAERSEELQIDVPNLKIRRRNSKLPDMGAVPVRKPKSLEIVIGGADRSPEKSLFVGNLADNVNEVLLYELFTQFGPVERVTMPLNEDTQKHKGFGFVQFADGPLNDGEHSVSYALKVLYDVELYGKRINVKRSTSGASSEPRVPRTLVRVGDLVELD